jgi:hypothetical protein
MTILMIYWISLSLMVSWYASIKGLGGVRFFLLSFLTSPMLGIIMSFFMPDETLPEELQ